MASETNKAIALIIPLIVKNNAGKVALALRDAGYSKDFIPAPDLEAKLFQLYNANPDLFFATMKSIPWNHGEKANDTNNPEVKEQLLAAVSQVTGKEISRDTWWPELLDYLNPALQTEEEIITGPSSRNRGLSFAVGFLFVLAIIGIIICLVLIFN